MNAEFYCKKNPPQHTEETINRKTSVTAELG